MPSNKKTFSQLEFAEEIKASERIKRKKDSARDSKAKQPSDEANDNANNNGKPKTSKKPIKRLREKRRQQSAQLALLAQQEEQKRKSRKVDADLEDHPGNIIASADHGVDHSDAGKETAISDFYWEVETVVGRRVHRGKVEYLIRWRGCSEEENTWEPAANLCDTAMEEAMKYVKAQKLKEKKREEDEQKLFADENEQVEAKQPGATMHGGVKVVEEMGQDAKEEDVEMEDVEGKEGVLDDLWDWTDKDQVVFHSVQRINIHDPTAPSIVKEARINGTPIVLIGHVGWADFAKRWISRKDDVAADAVAEPKVGAQDAAAVDRENSLCVEVNAVSSEGETINGDNRRSVSRASETSGMLKSETRGVDDVLDKAAHSGTSASLIINGSTVEHGLSNSDAITEPSTAGPTDTAEHSGTSMSVIGSQTNGTTNGPTVMHGLTNVSNEKGESTEITSSTALKSDAEAIVIDLKKNHAISMSGAIDGRKDDKNVEAISNCPKDGAVVISMTGANGAVSTSASSNDNEDSPLDLSRRDYYLDINKMIDDIGEEDVPVIKRHYNEEKPIHGTIHAAKFLTTCWPTAHSDNDAAKNQRTASKLYLHQWQFPLSDTAGRKLCHQNKPLPKSIMGEDLLKYWLDLPQCKCDSPLQYIFMGREDTLSKLHNDPGGLDISIAPIVGEKECVLVHRSDGSNCLYHLQASLNDIDLHQYPLLSQARIWRTIIQPGEILLMPHGTYHQCRNVTPCLSYSRFHLDTVNLLPFIQSLVNGDAPEIDQEEILWNLTSELISKIDKVFDATQSRVKQRLSTDEDLSEDVVEAVNILRTLRHFVREVARRHEIRLRLKGDESNSDHCFSTLVDDVDMCLHEFRFRKMRAIPPFKARQGKALKNTIANVGRKDVVKTDLSKFELGGRPVVAFNTILEVNYMSLKSADVDKLYPRASEEKVGEKLIKSLTVGEMVNVKLEQKVIKAEVLEVVSQMHSAYLSFEDYPSVYDEWQPTNFLRLPNRAEIPAGDIKPGLTVIDLSNKNEYRAKVVSTLNGPMAKMQLFVSQHVMTRWISPDMILGKYEPPKKQTKQVKKHPTVEIVEVISEAAPCRPKTGQVVDVHRKGAAWVTKCHYESEGEHPADPFPTHVDVRYILGQSHEEKMVPIEMVRLAPELDPDSGRSQRRLTEGKNRD